MKVILFGATGMVGQGVLRECLRDDAVEGVLAIGRSTSGQAHPKLRELPMIRVARQGAPKRVLENRDLLALGEVSS